MNIFERAVREKTRFAFKGSIGVEELWDLSLTNLDTIYGNLETELEGLPKKSLLSTNSKQRKEIEFKQEIIKHIVETKKIEAEQQFRDTRNVFKRLLDEITEESVNIVLELIAQGSLYLGEAHKGVLEKFASYQARYNQLSNRQKEIFVEEYAPEAGMVIGRIRNHSIGTLLTDISEGVDLDRAVRSYEAIVAPANYKRK